MSPTSNPPRTRPRRRLWRRRRKGIYTLWTILFLPILMLLLVIAVDISQLWLARAELENALEAAALAAVKEWGDASGGDTLLARTVGAEYAAANTLNGAPLVIPYDYNYEPANTPNQNDSGSGNLIFGAVTVEEGTPCNRYIFDAGSPASCGGGSVMLDASNNGNLKSGNEQEWGIAFQRANSDPSTLRIETVTYYLPAGNIYFDTGNLAGSGLTIADGAPPYKVTDGTPIGTQPDVFGFPNPATQITWTFSSFATGSTSRAKVLEFQFHPYPVSGDLGFEPCDRFRFGLNVRRLAGSAQYDGDDIGDFGVRVAIVFRDGATLLPPVYTQFVNTQATDYGLCGYRGNDPYCTNSVIVSALNIPDLPCPPVPGQGNNPDGQSVARLGGAGGGQAFGVRAQAAYAVPSLLCRFGGNTFGPFNVSACATAMYDCTERRPRLIRVEAGDYYCPGPIP